MRLRRRGFDEHSIEEAILKLKEQGLVDDLAFAQFWKDNRESFSPRSQAMLQRELRQKGIPPHIIDKVAEEVDDQASAYRSAQKKAAKLTLSDYPSFRHKLSNFLKRRGFNYEVTQHTINQLWQELKEG